MNNLLGSGDKGNDAAAASLLVQLDKALVTTGGTTHHTLVQILLHILHHLLHPSSIASISGSGTTHINNTETMLHDASALSLRNAVLSKLAQHWPILSNPLRQICLHEGWIPLSRMELLPSSPSSVLSGMASSSLLGNPSSDATLLAHIIQVLDTNDPQAKTLTLYTLAALHKVAILHDMACYRVLLAMRSAIPRPVTPGSHTSQSISEEEVLATLHAVDAFCSASSYSLASSHSTSSSFNHSIFPHIQSYLESRPPSSPHGLSIAVRSLRHMHSDLDLATKAWHMGVQLISSVHSNSLVLSPFDTQEVILSSLRSLTLLVRRCFELVEEHVDYLLKLVFVAPSDIPLLSTILVDEVFLDLYYLSKHCSVHFTAAQLTQMMNWSLKQPIPLDEDQTVLFKRSIMEICSNDALVYDAYGIHSSNLSIQSPTPPWQIMESILLQTLAKPGLVSLQIEDVILYSVFYTWMQNYFPDRATTEHNQICTLVIRHLERPIRENDASTNASLRKRLIHTLATLLSTGRSIQLKAFSLSLFTHSKELILFLSTIFLSSKSVGNLASGDATVAWLKNHYSTSPADDVLRLCFIALSCQGEGTNVNSRIKMSDSSIQFITFVLHNAPREAVWHLYRFGVRAATCEYFELAVRAFDRVLYIVGSCHTGLPTSMWRWIESLRSIFLAESIIASGVQACVADSGQSLELLLTRLKSCVNLFREAATSFAAASVLGQGSPSHDFQVDWIQMRVSHIEGVISILTQHSRLDFPCGQFLLPVVKLNRIMAKKFMDADDSTLDRFTSNAGKIETLLRNISASNTIQGDTVLSIVSSMCTFLPKRLFSGSPCLRVQCRLSPLSASYYINPDGGPLTLVLHLFLPVNLTRSIVLFEVQIMSCLQRDAGVSVQKSTIPVSRKGGEVAQEITRSVSIDLSHFISLSKSGDLKAEEMDARPPMIPLQMVVLGWDQHGRPFDIFTHSFSVSF